MRRKEDQVGDRENKYLTPSSFHCYPTVHLLLCDLDNCWIAPWSDNAEFIVLSTDNATYTLTSEQLCILLDADDLFPLWRQRE
jgi:hypothetical protein